MNDILEQIERELMGAVSRRMAVRRTRRRTLAAAALAAGALLLASMASAVTGVGPAGGLFRSDGSVVTGPQPVPGSPRVLLHAGGEGDQGWDLLFYRGKPGRHLPGRVGFYCLAVARSDAKEFPPGAASERFGPSPEHIYGGSTSCEYPRTLAARIAQRGIELHSGSNAPGSTTTPYYGLVLAEAEKVELRSDGAEPVDAELSPELELEVRRLPMALRKRFESPAQMRATAGVPRVVRVRAYLAALPATETAAGQHTPRVVASAALRHGRTRTDGLGGRRARRVPPPVAPLETAPSPGRPSVRLAGTGRDGVRWRSVAFQTRGGGVCAGAARPPLPAHRGALSCASPGLGVAEVLVTRGITSGLATGLRDGKRPKGSYAHYGLVPASVRRVVFPRPKGTPLVAQLSRPWATVRWSDSDVNEIQGRRTRRKLRRLPNAMRVRLFLAVIPPGVHDLQPVLVFEDGRRVRPYHG
jgi:hypothetical protein